MQGHLARVRTLPPRRAQAGRRRGHRARARATHAVRRRRARARAMAAPPAGDVEALLLALSHDELDVIVDGLADPLQPHVVVALGSTCKAMRTPMQLALTQLQTRHAAAKALCADLRCSVTTLRRTGILHLGDSFRRPNAWFPVRVPSRHIHTLVMLLGCGSLPALSAVDFQGLPEPLRDDERREVLVAQTFGHALRAASARSAVQIRHLSLASCLIDPAGANALASAMDHGALDRCTCLGLARTRLSDAAMEILTAPLRKLVSLETLVLDARHCCTRAAALVSGVEQGDFRRLRVLSFVGFIASATTEDVRTVTVAVPRLPCITYIEVGSFAVWRSGGETEEMTAFEQEISLLRAALDRARAARERCGEAVVG